MPGSPQYATEAVERMLAEARLAGASDLHVQPTAEGLELRWRLDGVLHPAACCPASVGPNVVARLKVLADLLTYRTDLPQEGRIKGDARRHRDAAQHVPHASWREGGGAALRRRREPTSGSTTWACPTRSATALGRLLQATSGMIVFSGPSGAGKTTTLYACLRELVAASGGRRNLATLEDPVEVAVAGVSQTQANPAAGFTLELGLRSLLRQDPEVIAVGEIRDRTTAEVAFQASLTGHLVLTTFHGTHGRLRQQHADLFCRDEQHGLLAALLGTTVIPGQLRACLDAPCRLRPCR